MLRGNVLVLGSLAASFALTKFPSNRPSLAMAFPLVFSVLGTVDTFRCLRMRWSFYHGAVMISLYMDAMALTMIAFLAFYPWVSRFR